MTKLSHWLGAVSLTTIATAAIAVLVQAQPSRPPNGIWNYRQFIQEVEKKNVRKVGVNADRTRLLVETKDSQQIWVNLQNNPNLIEILVKNDVDIYVMPNPSKVQRSPRETWRYSQFIQEVEKRNVQTVSLSADRTRAIVETKDSRRVWVTLPNDPELINLLTRNQVDIIVVPTMDPILSPQKKD